LDAEINIGNVDPVVKDGFLGKSQTYDSHDIEE